MPYTLNNYTTLCPYSCPISKALPLTAAFVKYGESLYRHQHRYFHSHQYEPLHHHIRHLKDFKLVLSWGCLQHWGITCSKLKIIHAALTEIPIHVKASLVYNFPKQQEFKRQTVNICQPYLPVPVHNKHYQWSNTPGKEWLQWVHALLMTPWPFHSCPKSILRNPTSSCLTSAQNGHDTI